MKAKYTDAYGSVLTEIINHPTADAHNLSMTIDGVLFEGKSFDDFELVNPKSYSKEQLQRFTLNKLKAYNTNRLFFELCNCTIEFDIPTKIIVTSDNSIINTLLKVNLELGKPSSTGGIDYEMAQFTIIIDNHIFTSKGDIFEEGLDDLKKQFTGRYIFKNCYGCLYSDYSPYGVSFFNSLFCFKAQKGAYLKLQDNFTKQAYLKLTEQNTCSVQESYCCSEFQCRKPNIGYRG